MLNFLIGLAILAVGYPLYGRLVERVLAPGDAPTPAMRLADGVDYVVLPQWRNMLIQLLNIAGIGPIIGVIIGIKFGAIVFILIPIGNIIGGAVHDFLAGMMSLREDGKNLPFITCKYLGSAIGRVFSAFLAVVLLLVVAVFVNVPANLAKGLLTEHTAFHDGQAVFWVPAIAIFVYYVLATLLPIDKIIGRFYPLFGMVLLFGSLGILGALLWRASSNPGLLAESPAFTAAMFTPENHHPIIPLLFVTIACGIMSGFHATQSPIIARTMGSEREARANFYGMMVTEGLIAMIWAGAALVLFNLFPADMALPAPQALFHIVHEFLGSWAGGVTVFSVIVLAVTSGDTAMRCLRLSVAEMLNVPQNTRAQRVGATVPLVACVGLLLWWSNADAASFNKLWNYFGWGNQVLASVTLLTAVVWLRRHGKCVWIAIVPGLFITFIVTSYILWTSPAHNGPYGLGLALDHALIIAAPLTLAAFVLAWRHGGKGEAPAPLETSDAASGAANG